MGKENLVNLSTESLYRKRNTLKGLIIGFGIIILLLIALLVYIYFTKGFQNVPIVSFIPLIALPITFTPVFILLNLINKEIDSRNI